MTLLALLAALACGCGLAAVIAGAAVTSRFARRAPVPAAPTAPITLMKPLCGLEPGLEEALASFCRQDHPDFHIVFGVQDPEDPAIEVVARLRQRFPAVDMALVVDPTPHGMNRKIANLLNMWPQARHECLIFADSDLHVAPDYLRRVQAALNQPGVGLVTTVYVGNPVVPGFAARLGATNLSHSFLPGALLSRHLGRQDCLGSTMALRRTTLEQVGGLRALSEHLADDNVLGQRVQSLGLAVALADTIPVTSGQEASLLELWSHELRWARTIGALAPLALAASALQYPITWALLAVAASAAAPWAIGLFILCWGGRWGTAAFVDRALRPCVGQPFAGAPGWLLPLRDLLSVAEIIASFAGKRVVWRGQAMTARPERQADEEWRALRDSNPRHAD